jgi:hypothetical protein
MRDASDAVDAYLTNRFGFGLDYEDGGSSALYQGMLTIEGVVYRFRCSIFTDAGGARFLESVGELETVRWDIRLVVPRAAAR